MAENRGKQFEGVIREALEKVDDVMVVRLPDPTNGYLGIRNIADFIVYQYPFIYFIECKSVHGNTFPLSNLTDNQYKGMVEKSKIPGVICGVIIWWVDKDITKYFPIEYIYSLKTENIKSIKYDDTWGYDVEGKKKKVFFDYDMEELLNMLANNERGWDC